MQTKKELTQVELAAQFKKNQQKVSGAIEIQAGNKAYNQTSGIYGLFAVVDRAQSAVTGYSMTNEVAQIRHGEHIQDQGNKPF